MLNVINEPFILNVIMLSVIMVIVIAPLRPEYNQVDIVDDR